MFSPPLSQVDFLIAPQILSACLDIYCTVYSSGPFRQLAAISRRDVLGTGAETSNVCGLAIVRSDRSDLKSYTDLANTKIEMVHPLIAEHGQLQLYDMVSPSCVTREVPKKERGAYAK